MVKSCVLAAMCLATYIEPMIQRMHETCKASFRENLSAMKELASDPIIHHQSSPTCNEAVRHRRPRLVFAFKFSRTNK
jgi:hypothetical protein